MQKMRQGDFPDQFLSFKKDLYEVKALNNPQLSMQ